MVTIEQVEQLEAKVSNAIDYVKRLTTENERLRLESGRLSGENNLLYGKLDDCQSRIQELEVLLQGFKQDQERIEQGIVSALERLNHFEDAIGETVAQRSSHTAVSNEPAGSQEGDSIFEEEGGTFSDDLIEPEVPPPPPSIEASADGGSSNDEEDASDESDEASDDDDDAVLGMLDRETAPQNGEGASEEWALGGEPEKPPVANAELDIY
jgi:FtsZ-binding cell division protein ZapB